MDVFNFPYHTQSTKYPDNGTRVQLGGNYVFSAPPAGPDLRVFSLTFPAMVYYPVVPLVPEHFNGRNFTLGASGSADLPDTALSMSASYDYPVYSSSATYVMNTKGTVLPTVGRIYKIEAEFRVSSYNGSDAATVRTGIRSLDNGLNSLGTQGGSSTPITGNGTYVVSAYFSDTAAGSVLAWPAGATYLRGYAQVAGTISTTVIALRRVTVTDETTPSVNGIDHTINPLTNLAVLEDFYNNHKMYKSFTYPHPVYGNLTVKFNGPLAIPVGTKGGAGVVEGMGVELVEIIV